MTRPPSPAGVKSIMEREKPNPDLLYTITQGKSHKNFIQLKNLPQQPLCFFRVEAASGAVGQSRGSPDCFHRIPLCLPTFNMQIGSPT